jgi:3-deoxy-D-manno-octulosonic-acid transferase
VGRFLKHFKPRAGVLIETEVWPNLVLQCQAQSVPLALANARMSEKSTRQALRWQVLMQPVFSALSAVWPQTEQDALRLEQLGVRSSTVLGNLKFEAQPDATQCAQGRVWRQVQSRPVAMLASSREGEEAAWLAAWQAVANSAPALQWLIVPRHPQRVNAVEALLQEQGLRVSRRSQWADVPQPADVWLGDSLGEMALYYSLSDVALLGGSFEPWGGQNLIEAAACGCPVIMGPHTFNFTQAAEMAEQAGAALRARDMGEALKLVRHLLQDRTGQTVASKAAHQFAQAHQGAAQRTACAVRDLLA